jgi:hypothetical protein
LLQPLPCRPMHPRLHLHHPACVAAVQWVTRLPFDDRRETTVLPLANCDRLAPHPGPRLAPAMHESNFGLHLSYRWVLNTAFTEGGQQPMSRGWAEAGVPVTHRRLSVGWNGHQRGRCVACCGRQQQGKAVADTPLVWACKNAVRSKMPDMKTHAQIPAPRHN